jgi:hypothetical protein
MMDMVRSLGWFCRFCGRKMKEEESECTCERPASSCCRRAKIRLVAEILSLIDQQSEWATHEAGKKNPNRVAYLAGYHSSAKILAMKIKARVL